MVVRISQVLGAKYRICQHVSMGKNPRAKKNGEGNKRRGGETIEEEYGED